MSIEEASDKWCILAINCKNAVEAETLAKLFYYEDLEFKQRCISYLLGYFAGKNTKGEKC